MSWAKDANGIPQPVSTGWFSDKAAKRNAIKLMAYMMELTVSQLWDIAQKRNVVIHESKDFYRGEKGAESRLTVKYRLERR